MIPLLTLLPLALKAVAAAGGAADVIKALGGQSAGEAVEKVVGIAKAVTGEAEPEKALKAVVADPAIALEMEKQLSGERKFFAELEQRDRADARARDVAFLQAGRKNLRGDVLAYSAVGSLILCIVLLFMFKVPSESRDLLLVTLGALVAIVKDVFGFEFGSSKDSARNSQAVVDALKNGNG